MQGAGTGNECMHGAPVGDMEGPMERRTEEQRQNSSGGFQGVAPTASKRGKNLGGDVDCGSEAAVGMAWVTGPVRISFLYMDHFFEFFV